MDIYSSSARYWGAFCLGNANVAVVRTPTIPGPRSSNVKMHKKYACASGLSVHRTHVPPRDQSGRRMEVDVQVLVHISHRRAAGMTRAIGAAPGRAISRRTSQPRGLGGDPRSRGLVVLVPTAGRPCGLRAVACLPTDVLSTSRCAAVVLPALTFPYYPDSGRCLHSDATPRSQPPYVHLAQPASDLQPIHGGCAPDRRSVTTPETSCRSPAARPASRFPATGHACIVSRPDAHIGLNAFCGMR